MVAELVKRVREWFESAREWERKTIAEAGNIVVELVKLPSRETRRGTEPARVALQIRRRDAFKGLLIYDVEALEDLRKVVTLDSVRKVVEAVEEVNKEVKVYL